MTGMIPLVNAQANFNDWLQWGVVTAIIIITAFSIIKRTVRFRKHLKSKNAPARGCSESCAACSHSDCGLRYKKHGGNKPRHKH